MTDQQFLDYLETHLGTPDCGVTPEQIARLLRLSGGDALAEYWDKQPLRVVRKCHDDVRKHLGMARERIAASASSQD